MLSGWAVRPTKGDENTGYSLHDWRDLDRFFDHASIPSKHAFGTQVIYPGSPLGTPLDSAAINPEGA